jgi:hypothetical protein
LTLPTIVAAGKSDATAAFSTNAQAKASALATMKIQAVTVTNIDRDPTL